MELTSVITNVVGTTGRAISDALIAGERDPQVLAGVAVGRARKKTTDLVGIVDLVAGHDGISNLDSLPGVGRRAAEVVLAETGGDMTRFAAPKAPWNG
ncbi:transposase [Plantactinospora sp. WMMC1484]|uniref:transposase n=1 Tax=Plantactinospora sp. WMMC1484 TaxID=3404122 RepID=UPI003BF619A7